MSEKKLEKKPKKSTAKKSPSPSQKPKPKPKPKKGPSRPKKTQAEYDEQDRLIKATAPPSFPWSVELEDAICFEISTTAAPVKTILDANSLFPSERQLYKKIFNDPNFEQKYTKARQLQQDVKLAAQHDVLERARVSTYLDLQGNHRIDAPAVALAKLECDNIKWEASKLNRKKYGKIEIEITDAKDARKSVAEHVAKAKKHAKDY